jgi:hypothetical protein
LTPEIGIGVPYTKELKDKAAEIDSEADKLISAEVKKITGLLWWKKTKTEVDWKFVDKWGNCLWATYGYVSVNNYHEKIKSFDNLQDAFDKIDLMIAGAKFHYR